MAGKFERTKGGFILRMLPGNHFFQNSSKALLLRVVAQTPLQLAGAWNAGADPHNSFAAI